MGAEHAPNDFKTGVDASFVFAQVTNVVVEAIAGVFGEEGDVVFEIAERAAEAVVKVDYFDQGGGSGGAGGGGGGSGGGWW